MKKNCSINSNCICFKQYDWFKILEYIADHIALYIRRIHLSRVHTGACLRQAKSYSNFIEQASLLQ